jgi:hypothetical protein
VKLEMFPSGGSIFSNNEGTIQEVKDALWAAKEFYGSKVNWAALENTIRQFLDADFLSESEKLDLIAEAMAAFTGRGR